MPNNYCEIYVLFHILYISYIFCEIATDMIFKASKNNKFICEKCNEFIKKKTSTLRQSQFSFATSTFIFFPLIVFWLSAFNTSFPFPFKIST